jgi:hypothetical protein
MRKKDKRERDKIKFKFGRTKNCLDAMRINFSREKQSRDVIGEETPKKRSAVSEEEKSSLSCSNIECHPNEKKLKQHGSFPFIAHAQLRREQLVKNANYHQLSIPCM